VTFWIFNTQVVALLWLSSRCTATIIRHKRRFSPNTALVLFQLRSLTTEIKSGLCLDWLCVYSEWEVSSPFQYLCTTTHSFTEPLAQQLTVHVYEFYVYGSVHRWSILITVQRDATQSSLFVILQVHSTCFRCQPHPSSGIHKTLITASSTGHIFCAATSFQRGQTSLAMLEYWRL